MRVSKTLTLPFGTLSKRASNVSGNKFSVGLIKGYLSNEITALSIDQKQELTEHVKQIFRYNNSEIHKLAFQWAERNSMGRSFNKENEAAGWYWLKGFLRIHIHGKGKRF